MAKPSAVPKQVRKWTAIYGPALEEKNGWFIFPGVPVEATPYLPEGGHTVGLYICDQYFSNGRLEAEVDLGPPGTPCSLDLVYDFNPTTRATLGGGIPMLEAYAIRAFDKQWEAIEVTGTHDSVRGHPHHLILDVQGSLVTLSSDGTIVLRAVVRRPHFRSQVGLLIVGSHPIKFRNFSIEAEKSKAFVIMQFSSPYDEVYWDVIKTVCPEMGVEARRVDEAAGPGLIIADIVNSIMEATLVIADITPVNANVFYELGFAHGLNKPAILLAEKGTTLPFDVSPFRTLFYENTIGGKAKLEAGLRRALGNILGAPSIPDPA